MPRTPALILLAPALLAAVVGAVDAAAGGAWDLFAILVVVACLVTAAIATMRTRRASVTLRRDLHRWLADEAELTGESIERILDRTVAARRAVFDAELLGPSRRR